MFGFPETLEQFTLKHYIRLCAIICGYLIIRPFVDRLYARLGEKDRQKMLKKEQEEAARAHKEHRVKEKLGISVDEPLPEEIKTANTATTTATEAASHDSVTKMLRRKPKSEQQKLKKIYDDMISDEDIEDILTRVDSSKED